jgi:hypothetical protein
MSWEEIERGTPGQLNLPTFTPAPVVAERVFLTLARQWHNQVAKAQKETPLPSDTDQFALACLILSVEHGPCFTGVALDQMARNLNIAKWHRPSAWYDQLPWKLCRACQFQDPVSTDAVEELVANLDHHNSTIRWWMMELGWFVVPWLDPVEAPSKLLKNLADTLGGPFEAAGLASRFFDTPDSFFTFARHFTPPSSFEEQYKERLKFVEETGVAAMQAHYWELEAKVRKTIGENILPN